MAHKKYRIRKALAALGVVAAAIATAATMGAATYRDAHAAPITVAPAVTLDSAVRAQKARELVQDKRTPVFPQEQPVPRTVKGPVISDNYTYHTTYLYNPSRVCTALVPRRSDVSSALSCVLVPQ